MLKIKFKFALYSLIIVFSFCAFLLAKPDITSAALLNCGDDICGNSCGGEPGCLEENYTNCPTDCDPPTSYTIYCNPSTCDCFSSVGTGGYNTFAECQASCCSGGDDPGDGDEECLRDGALCLLDSQCCSEDCNWFSCSEGVTPTLTPRPTSTLTPTLTPTLTIAPTVTTTITPTPTDEPTNPDINFGVVEDDTETTGRIIKDDDKNGIQDPGEVCYAGDVDLYLNGDGQNYTSDADCDPPYSVSSGEECDYISITAPDGYKIVAWSSSDGRSGTTIPPGGVEICGEYTLDFFVSNSNPWIQIVGSDARIDSGFEDLIPSTASCGPYVGAYASISIDETSPGIIYSGDSPATFGEGQASVNNWNVGGTGDLEEIFNPELTQKTSYQFLYSSVKQSGTTPTDITPFCGVGGVSNCTLSSSLASGTYISNEALVLNGSDYVFEDNSNYIILVNGDLTINHKINVPVGSTAIFSSAGSIYIGENVGESVYTSYNPTISGLFSADQDFVILGGSNCTVGPDPRFNLGGTIIINAKGEGGSLINQRDLCEGNLFCPAVAIIPRNDFVLNMPRTVKRPNYIWQEVAP